MKYMYTGKTGSVKVGNKMKNLTSGQVFEFDGELTSSKFIPLLEYKEVFDGSTEPTDEKEVHPDDESVENKLETKVGVMDKSFTKTKFRRKKRE